MFAPSPNLTAGRERAHSAALPERLIRYLAQAYPSFGIGDAFIPGDRLILVIEGAAGSHLSPGDVRINA